MRALIVIATCVLSLAVLVGVSVFAEGSTATETARRNLEQESSIPVIDGRLRVPEHQRNHIAGSYTDASSTVSFDGHHVRNSSVASPSRVAQEIGSPLTTAHVKVNGFSFTWDFNPETKVYEFDGPDRAIPAKDIRALEEAGRALGRHLGYGYSVGNDQLPSEQQLLMGTFIYLSEAPVRYKITDSTEKLEVVPPPKSERSPNSSPITLKAAQSAHTKQQEASELTCKDKAIRSGDFREFTSCARGDNEGWALSCATKTRNHSHDAKNAPPAARHCFLTYGVKSGPCSSRCKGMCGRDCNGGFNTNGYYKDCLDHDECAITHNASGGSSDPVCGDEWGDARGDFAKASMGGGYCRRC